MYVFLPPVLTTFQQLNASGSFNRSMKKLYAVAIAASTAGLWREEELSDDLSSILSKVKNHPGETDGSAEAEDEEENVNDGIVSYDYNDFLHLTGGECVPHKLLGLAKKGQK